MGTLLCFKKTLEFLTTLRLLDVVAESCYQIDRSLVLLLNFEKLNSAGFRRIESIFLTPKAFHERPHFQEMWRNLIHSNCLRQIFWSKGSVLKRLELLRKVGA